MMKVGSIRKRIWNAWLALSGNVPYKQSNLERWQSLSKDKILSEQERRVVEIIKHAYSCVPYYKEVFSECGVVEDGNVCLEHFKDIPLLDKNILRGRFEELRSSDLKQREWIYNTSGGSTGEPARFIQDRNQLSWATAVKNLFDCWTGYEVGMPRIRLWGSERDILVGKETIKTRLRRMIRNEYFLNSFQMGEREMLEFVDVINKIRPVQILAYVESIFELARFIEREGLEVHSPKAVMTSAGTLYPNMRKTIQRVFRAPVFNRYGSREVGDIACECEVHEGLHICVPTHYVEVLRADGTPAKAGEVGEIVVTLLTNKAMPLIRYRIGDMGVWAKDSCSCGRSWPLLAKVTGRVSDTFVSEQGDVVHGEFFTHLFYHRDWVRKFQVIQESINQIIVKIVPEKTELQFKEYYRDEMLEIEQNIRMAMGEGCTVRFQFEEEIAPSRSGKYRYTISKVKQV